MSEIQTEEKKGFSWMGFLFAPAYYAGYGKLQKGIVLALIGAIPFLGLVVFIYGGVKAKKELPVGKENFKWGSAIGVFLILAILGSMANGAISSFSPAFQKEIKMSTLDDISGVWRGEADGAMVTINLIDTNKSMLINKNSFPVVVKSIDTENNVVALNVNTNEGTVIWTIQQIFQEDNRFNLVITLHNGTQDNLTFIRNIQ